MPIGKLPFMKAMTQQPNGLQRFMEKHQEKSGQRSKCAPGMIGKCAISNHNRHVLRRSKHSLYEKSFENSPYSRKRTQRGGCTSRCCFSEDTIPGRYAECPDCRAGLLEEKVSKYKARRCDLLIQRQTVWSHNQHGPVFLPA